MAAAKQKPRLPAPDTYLTDGVNLVQFLGLDDEDKCVVEDCSLDADDPAALRRIAPDVLAEEWTVLAEWVKPERA